jgi:hypothetical protein
MVLGSVHAKGAWKMLMKLTPQDKDRDRKLYRVNVLKLSFTGFLTLQTIKLDFILWILQLYCVVRL